MGNQETLDYTRADMLANELIDIVTAYLTSHSKDEIHQSIWKAYIFAREAHGNQTRKSGEAYITHPLEAAKILSILKPDIVSIQSCILHDVIEDTEYSEEDIREAFGDDVAKICQGLSKLSNIRYKGEERSVESLRKMLLAMVDDLRVIIVKLADRLHNMQTLEFHPDPKKRERIALETLNIYAPIADRLGIFRFKEDLENECFRILYPEEYHRISSELEALHTEQTVFLAQTEARIRSIFTDVPVISIGYRVKSAYSIYKKIHRKEDYGDVKDLYDLFAVRIITDNIRHCYEILGMLHSEFTPLPKRFKDYIALPKENGYQSLHTTVMGLFPELRKQPTEIQIRTASMHAQAENGVAAHFAYSESGKSSIAKDSYWVNTIKKILDENKETGEFMSEMKVSIFSDQIFVFTPKGDVINLPKGSTPIDFAYSIHSDIGNTLSIAKVDGRVVSLDYELHNGEVVSIIRDKNKKPKPIWLSFVKTSKAREYIRQFINREERDFFIDKGRKILDSYLSKHYGKGLDKELSILKNFDGTILDTKEREDILVQLGNLSRKPTSVLRAIHDSHIKEILGEKIEETIDKKEDKNHNDQHSNHSDKVEVIIGKERNIPHKFAQCCSPTPSDKKIIGIIGHGQVTIHTFNCSEVEKTDLDRRITVRWSSEPEREKTTLTIDITFHDKKGILMKLTEIFFHSNLNITHFSTENIKSGITRDIFTLESESDEYYIFERLENKLRFEIPEIIDITLVNIEY